MKEALRLVVPLDVERRDGKKLAPQTPEDVLLKVLIAVSQDGLGEGQALRRRIGGVDAPPV